MLVKIIVANMICSCQCTWVNTCGLTCCQLVRGSCLWDATFRGEVVMHVGPNFCAYMLCMCQCLQCLLTCKSALQVHTNFVSCRTCLYREMTCHPVCQTVCEPYASQADSPRFCLHYCGGLAVAWGSQSTPCHPEPLHPAAEKHSTPTSPIGCHALGRRPFKGGVMVWWIC